jgi:hypothetical protein
MELNYSYIKSYGRMFALLLGVGLTSSVRAEEVEECEERVESFKDHQVKSNTCGPNTSLRIFSKSKLVFEEKDVYFKDYAFHRQQEKIYFLGGAKDKTKNNLKRVMQYDLNTMELTQALDGVSLIFIKIFSETKSDVITPEGVWILTSKKNATLYAAFFVDLLDESNPIRSIALKPETLLGTIKIDSIHRLSVENQPSEYISLLVNDSGYGPIMVLLLDRQVGSIYKLNSDNIMIGSGFDVQCGALFFMDAREGGNEGLEQFRPVIMKPGVKPLSLKPIIVNKAEAVDSVSVERGVARFSWTESSLFFFTKNKSKNIIFKKMCRK